MFFVRDKLSPRQMIFKLHAICLLIAGIIAFYRFEILVIMNLIVLQTLVIISQKEIMER